MAENLPHTKHSHSTAPPAVSSEAFEGGLHEPGPLPVCGACLIEKGETGYISHQPSEPFHPRGTISPYASC